jgi:hypothetical protein
MFIHGKRLRRKLKEAGAVSAETAKTIEELDLSGVEIRTLKRNVMIGKVQETKDHRYYVPCEDEK